MVSKVQYLALFCALFNSAASVIFSYQVHRKAVPAVSIRGNAFHRREATNIPNVELEEYQLWFGNYTVGDSKAVELIIDTGSADLLLDPGRYVSSSKSKPYQGTPAFSITYEGVDAQGGGFETINGTVLMDIVTGGELTVPEQAFGNITSYSVQDAPPKPEALMQDGIIGFLGAQISSFTPQSNSWFTNLCNISAISQCRFALAYGTKDKGLQVIGDVDKSLFKDELTISPLHTEIYPLYTTQGDVSFNNKIKFTNQSIIMDSGTQNIQMPAQLFKEVFKAFNYTYSTYVGGPSSFDPSSNFTYLTGYFPCNAPPTLTFTFPSEAVRKRKPAGAHISKKSKSFNLLSSFSTQDNGNNNCTAVVAGTNALYISTEHANAWLVGQPFFQGHYVDFDITNNALGFADLVDPKTAGQ